MKRIAIVVFIIACALSTGFVTFEIPPQLAIGNVSIDAPMVLGEESEIIIPKSNVRFVGDVMLARNVELLMDTYGYMYPFTLLPTISDDTYLVGNFEASVPRVHVPTPSMKFSFSVKEEYLKALREYGFTHVSLANNHAYDFGIEDFNNTQNALRNASTTPFGNPKQFSNESVTTLRVGSTTIALIAVHAVHVIPTQEQIVSVLSYASTVSDIQVIYVHWGDEYEVIHNANQETLAKTFIDNGAEVIVGHHPHVVQDIEKYKDGIIFYSLGNFIFDQYFSDDVQTGLAISLTIKDSKMNFELIPVTSIGSRSAPREMTAYEKDVFLTKLSENSDTELAFMIKSGVIVHSF